MELLSKEEVLKVIDEEPEYPGPIPDAMWTAINGNRDLTTETLRLSVRLTKSEITNRINALQVNRGRRQA